MNNTRPRLHLVPLVPNDYSVGNVLGFTQDAQPGSAADEVGAALSLYLLWPGHRRAMLLDVQLNRFRECEISCDQDEREPEYLWIDTNKDELPWPLTNVGDQLTIRFEVFGSCFEMSSSVAQIEDMEEKLRFIVTVPSKLTLFDDRQLPRLILTASERSNLPEMHWHSEGLGDPVRLSISEISVKSLLANVEQSCTTAVGTLQVGTELFPAEIVDVRSGGVVIVLHFEDGLQAGIFFDIYRTISYPSLRSKYEQSLDESFQLMKETGFLDKYNSPEAIKRCSENLVHTWESIRSAFHQYHAEYCSVDGSGILSGMSSATVGYVHQGLPVWSWHQLCARTDPDLLEQTGILYTWRAEYLAGRPGDCSIFSRYTSRSRWIERIYTKFSLSNVRDSRLRIVKSIQTTVGKNNGRTHPSNLTKLPFGTVDRLCVEADGAIGGAFPPLLNAAENLDCVMTWEDDATSESCINAAQALLDASGKDELKLFFTTDDLETPVPEGSHVSKIDRIIVFKKAGLAHFIASVEHSIAVTMKKYAHVK